MPVLYSQVSPVLCQSHLGKLCLLLRGGPLWHPRLRVTGVSADHCSGPSVWQILDVP